MSKIVLPSRNSKDAVEKDIQFLGELHDHVVKSGNDVTEREYALKMILDWQEELQARIGEPVKNKRNKA